MARSKYDKWRQLSSINFQTDGFNSFRGEPDLMKGAFHRHNELEFNFLDQGSMVYIFGGSRFTVEAGCLYVFWAGTPHRVVEIAPGTTFQWVTVPLGFCLQWQLAYPFFHQVLFAKLLYESDPAQGPFDQMMLRKWHEDLKSGSQERQRIVLLEVEARLRRLSLSLSKGWVAPKEGADKNAPLGESGLRKVEQMAMYIADNYTKPLRVEDIARTVGLHPNYAMRLFHKTFGSSLVDYITQHRVMHAQRLLTLSDAKVLDVALDSGFGSLSRFYTAFQRACGQAPGSYRRSLPGTGDSPRG